MKGKKKSDKKFNVKFNFRSPEHLIEFAKKYAEERNTSVSSLLVGFLTSLKEKENG